MSDPLLRTSLYAEHVAAGAKMVPFAGYEMPIQYPSGITAEHAAVRTAVGVFDVSHMGEFAITGTGALDLIQAIGSNDAGALEIGQAQYSTLPREYGGILDDMLVYRFEDHYMLVVNASNRAKDLEWVRRQAMRFGARVEDRSDSTALIALQGPRASDVLARLTAHELDSIAYYRFAPAEVDEVPAVVSRTGYTGEDGFELYLSPDDAPRVWRSLLIAGKEDGILPAGLGARDTLRLEMGYPLYGNDLDETRTPLEAGLGWVTKLDRKEFLAGDALRRSKEKGVESRLIGFRLLGRAFPRPGYEIAHEGQVVGSVTSGTMSPSLGVGIGLGYVPTALSRAGTHLEILVRGQPIPAEVVRLPFYTAGSIRR